MAEKSIYLASRSPRRRDLLRQIGVAFELVLLREAPRYPADFDETPLADEVPDDYVLRMAREKAQAAVTTLRTRRLALRPVLAADTTVVCDETILGKPADSADAVRMLGLLAGRMHRVLTAVAVAGVGDDVAQVRVSESRVWFRTLAADEIRRYVASGETVDKAGAYAVQGRAAAFITRIEGSYSGIMGLPLAETADLLRSHGIIVP
jgi:septum formation protein